MLLGGVPGTVCAAKRGWNLLNTVHKISTNNLLTKEKPDDKKPLHTTVSNDSKLYNFR